MPVLDIVVPAYNESEVIDRFLTGVLTVAGRFASIPRLAGWTARIILVDDGSSDDTAEKIRSWIERDRRIELVVLSRNFGHEAALAAGLEASRGDAAIVMDADLQDPPELIPALVDRFLDGFDVVNAHRSRRRGDGVFKRFTAATFYRLINAFSPRLKIPANVGNYRLISRRVVRLLCSLPETNRVFRVLVPYLGFPTASVDYERPVRPAGTTHYSTRSMFRLAVDGIASATTIPLKLAVRAGAAVSAAGFIYLAWVLFEALVLGTTVEGWASTMAVLLFLGGIQLVFLGVLGEYLGRVFDEAKRRPAHIASTHITAENLHAVNSAAEGAGGSRVTAESRSITRAGAAPNAASAGVPAAVPNAGSDAASAPGASSAPGQPSEAEGAGAAPGAFSAPARQPTAAERAGAAPHTGSGTVEPPTAADLRPRRPRAHRSRRPRRASSRPTPSRRRGAGRRSLR